MWWSNEQEHIKLLKLSPWQSDWNIRHFLNARRRFDIFFFSISTSKVLFNQDKIFWYDVQNYSISLHYLCWLSSTATTTYILFLPKFDDQMMALWWHCALLTWALCCTQYHVRRYLFISVNTNVNVRCVCRF